MENTNKNLENSLDDFLGEESKKENKQDCTSNECKIKSKDGLIERIDKKYITNDGRELIND